MSNDSALPGQSEGAIDWNAGLPESEWVRIKPGDVVTMTIVGRELRDSNLHPGEQELVATVLVDGVERKWSPNVGALRELGSANVREGDTVRVHRTEDTKRGARTFSNWIIERIADAPGVTTRTTVDAEMDARVDERKEGDDEPLPF
jgi:hypothetical protein